jgi:hypothetical protein
MTTPSSVAETFFMKSLPSTPVMIEPNSAGDVQPAEQRLLSDPTLQSDDMNLA